MSFNNKNYTFTQILIIKFIFFIIIFFLIIGAITTTIKSKNFPTKKIILKTTTTEPTKMETWAKIYGGKGDISINSIYPTRDNGYIAIGYTYISGMSDALIIKLDSLGNPQWARAYGRNNTGDYIGSIASTSDGGYIVAGHTYVYDWDYDKARYDVLVFKIDSSGNLQWARTYGGDKDEYGQLILPTPDNGYIVVGGAYLSGNFYDILIFKLGSLGNVQWSKIYGRTENDYVNSDYIESILPTPDGGYIAVGNIYVSGNDDVLIIKLDSSGNLQWAKKIGGKEFDGAYFIAPTSDKGYIVVGDSYNLENNSDVLVLKLDPSGNVKWVRLYGGVYGEYAHAVVPTPDDDYVITGCVYDSKNCNTLVIRLDSAGNIEWAKTYEVNDRDNNEYAHSIIPTPDGGYMVIGESSTLIRSERFVKSFILKFDFLGNISDCYLGQPFNLSSTFPSFSSSTLSVPVKSFALPALNVSLLTSSPPLSYQQICSRQ